MVRNEVLRDVMCCSTVSECALLGMLRLELPKDVYERVGLVGKPILDGGRKHMKSRFGRKTPKSMKMLPLNSVSSNRSQPSLAIYATWKKRIREDRLGFQERPQPLRNMALLRLQRS